QHGEDRELRHLLRGQPRATSQLHPAPLELRQRHPVDPGIRSVEPAELSSRCNGDQRRFLFVQVEPADLRLGRESFHLFGIAPPACIEPIGQASFEQRAHVIWQDCDHSPLPLAGGACGGPVSSRAMTAPCPPLTPPARGRGTQSFPPQPPQPPSTISTPTAGAPS